MKSRALVKKAIEMRVEALQMIFNAGSGASGAAASAVEILVALYYGILNDQPILAYDVTNPGWSDQDHFVLSKIAAAPVLYSILADIGFFAADDLKTFRRMDGSLEAFANLKVNGVSATVGNLGYGLSVALGMALVAKQEKRPSRIFTLIEDTELQNGQIWEAALSAAHFKVDNLIAIVEYSQTQADGVVRKIMNIEPLAEKFEAFGWKVIKVHDGHDFELLLEALSKAVAVHRKPVVILARTTIGKGIPFAEGKHTYYGASLSKVEMETVIKQAEILWHRA